MALGLVNNRVRISSIFPPPLGEELPSIPAETFWGKTTFHRCVVKWGEDGFIDCGLHRASPLTELTSLSRADQIRDAATTDLLLEYKIAGVKVPAEGSIKTGLYRAVVSGPAAAVVGDFDFFKK